MNPDNPNEGMIFDGRIAEDFKLDTGTWVSVGSLRAKLIEAGKGFIQDVVITGHDKPFIGAIIFPVETATNLRMDEQLQNIIDEFNQTSTGSSTRIQKAIIAPFTLSSEMGEITDKGSINQRAVLSNRKEIVEQIYSSPAPRGGV